MPIMEVTTGPLAARFRISTTWAAILTSNLASPNGAWSSGCSPKRWRSLTRLSMQKCLLAGPW